MRRLASTALWLILACAASAQDATPEQTPQSGAGATVEREVKARSGRETRLAVFTNVKPDCTSGALPTVRLVTAPTNGTITVKRGKLRATNIKQCLALEVPALAAIYRAPPEFEGSDTIVIEVRPAEGNGAPQLRRFTITVTNTDNGLSTTCTNTLDVAKPADADIVIDTNVYVAIADLVDAPVPVRLSW